MLLRVLYGGQQQQQRLFSTLLAGSWGLWSCLLIQTAVRTSLGSFLCLAGCNNCHNLCLQYVVVRCVSLLHSIGCASSVAFVADSHGVWHSLVLGMPRVGLVCVSAICRVLEEKLSLHRMPSKRR